MPSASLLSMRRVSRLRLRVRSSPRSPRSVARLRTRSIPSVSLSVPKDPSMKTRARSDSPSPSNIALTTPMCPTRNRWPTTPRAVSPWTAVASTSASASTLPTPMSSAPSCWNSRLPGTSDDRGPAPPSRCSPSYLNTVPQYCQRSGEGPFRVPSMYDLTTEDVNSGRRLTLRPLGSVKLYIRAASSPPDLRRKSSVCSRMGVATTS